MADTGKSRPPMVLKCYELLDNTRPELQVMHIVDQAINELLQDDADAKKRVLQWLSGLLESEDY